MTPCFYPVDYAVLRRTSPSWQIPTRTIKNHELVFFLEGRMEIMLDGQRFSARSGMLFYFQPGHPHSLQTDDEDPALFFGLHFSPPPGEVLPLEPVTRWPDFRKFIPLMEETVRLWNRKAYLDDWAVNLTFSQLLLELFREEGTAAPSVRQRIGKALDYIHAHPDRPVTVEELCQLTGMKKSYLIRSFQQVTGQPPIQYAIQLRLEHARAILLNEPVPVGEVARRCGFRDEFYFSRMFRKRYGLSPSQFRRQEAGV